MTEHDSPLDIRPTLSPRKIKKEKRRGFSSYEIIAKEFTWDGYGFFGPVVVSRAAFFMMVDMNESAVRAAGMAGALFGAAGAMIGYAIAKGLTAKQPQSGELDIADLFPEERDRIRMLTGKRRGRVIIVPRQYVTKLKYTWGGALRIITEDVSFSVSPNFWKRRRVIKLLRHLGWEI